jgi:hypothetical protein
VTVCVPAVSADVLADVADPEDSVTGEPELLPSIVNCTVPVGEFPVTLAVKLTAWPYVKGFELEATDVVVGCWQITEMPVALDVDAASFAASPGKYAITLLLPQASAEPATLSVADAVQTTVGAVPVQAFATRAALPRLVPPVLPIKKLTTPDGTPPLLVAVTVPVSVVLVVLVIDEELAEMVVLDVNAAETVQLSTKLPMFTLPRPVPKS